MTYILIFLVSLILTIFFTPYLINYFKRIQIVDHPDPRKIHNSSIPHMGGIIIYLVVLFSSFSFYPYDSSHLYLLIASLFILACGIFDDIIGIKWSLKFLLQTVAVILLVYYFNFFTKTLVIFGIPFHSPFNVLIIFLFIIGAINSINLMDGLDGLVTGYSFLAFSMLIIFAYQTQDFFLMAFLAAAIGSTLGFLKFNSFPASLFLGDTGSLILGFFLILPLLIISHQFSGSGEMDLSFAIIFLGVPIIDTLKVMAIRLVNKTSPFMPDKNHFHHQLIGRDISHKITVFIIQLFALFCALNALIYIKFDKSIAIILFIIFSLTLIFVKNILRFFQKYENYIKAIRVRMLPDLLIRIYKKQFFVVTFFIIFYILLYNFYANSLFKANQLILIFILNLILLIICILHKLKNKFYNNIYVFFNILIFFTLRGIVEPIIHGNIYKYFCIFGVFIIILFIVLFLLSRERMSESYNGFFTGFELILLVFIISINLSFQFFQISHFNFIFYGIIVSFIIYIWYRIIIYLRPEMSTILFFISFIVSLFSTLYQIVNTSFL